MGHTVTGQDERCAPRRVGLRRGCRRVCPDLAGSHTGRILHGQTQRATLVAGGGRSCSGPPVFRFSFTPSSLRRQSGTGYHTSILGWLRAARTGLLRRGWNQEMAVVVFDAGLRGDHGRRQS